ncbi:hypothetical protein PMI09_02193 [Rhizobium sp. CF122]|nr:hypothetical protein PMI09_02193 [Rhizobium sp. CF122]
MEGMLRTICIVILGSLLCACTSSSSSGQWHRVASTEQGQLKQAEVICRGQATNTQAAYGRLWIAGAVASESAFKGCMAEKGYVQN